MCELAKDSTISERVASEKSDLYQAFLAKSPVSNPKIVIESDPKVLVTSVAVSRIEVLTEDTPSMASIFLVRGLLRPVELTERSVSLMSEPCE